MAAPAGNKNAQKWTHEKTDEVLQQIESFSIKMGMEFLTEAFEYAGVYPAIWTYWQKIWAQDADIIHRMRMVELRFYNRLLKNIARGKYKAGVAQLLLKNNCGFSGHAPDHPVDADAVLPVVPTCVMDIVPIADIRFIPPYPSYQPPLTPSPLDDLTPDAERIYAMTVHPPGTGT